MGKKEKLVQLVMNEDVCEGSSEQKNWDAKWTVENNEEVKENESRLNRDFEEKQPMSIIQNSSF